MKIKTYMSGLKIIGIEEFLFEVAQVCNLEYETIKEKRGILRETIFFEIEGEIENLNRFNEIVKKVVEERNN